MIPPNKLSNTTQESNEKMLEAQEISNSLETRDDSKSSLAHLLKQPQMTTDETSDGPIFKEMPTQLDVRVKSNSMIHPKFRSFVNLIGASQEDSKQLSD